MINELTKEQEEYLPVFREEQRKIGLSTERINYELAIKSVHDLYEVSGLDRPNVMVFSSPMMCLLARGVIAILPKFRDQLGDQLYQSLWFANTDVWWTSLYNFSLKIGVNYDCMEKLEKYNDFTAHCGALFPYKNIAFVSDRPSKLSFDDRGLLHSEDGMAIEYSDGWGLCSWHGVKIPEEWIFNKESVTAEVAIKHQI